MPARGRTVETFSAQHLRHREHETAVTAVRGLGRQIVDEQNRVWQIRFLLLAWLRRTAPALLLLLQQNNTSAGAAFATSTFRADRTAYTPCNGTTMGSADLSTRRSMMSSTAFTSGLSNPAASFGTMRRECGTAPSGVCRASSGSRDRGHTITKPLVQDEAWFNDADSVAMADTDSSLDTDLLLDCPTLFLPEPPSAPFLASGSPNTHATESMNGRLAPSSTPSPNLNSDLLKRPPSRQRDLPIHLNADLLLQRQDGQMPPDVQRK